MKCHGLYSPAQLTTQSVLMDPYGVTTPDTCVVPKSFSFVRMFDTGHFSITCNHAAHKQCVLMVRCRLHWKGAVHIPQHKTVPALN